MFSWMLVQIFNKFSLIEKHCWYSRFSKNIFQLLFFTGRQKISIDKFIKITVKKAPNLEKCISAIYFMLSNNKNCSGPRMKYGFTQPADITPLDWASCKYRFHLYDFELPFQSAIPNNPKTLFTAVDNMGNDWLLVHRLQLVVVSNSLNIIVHLHFLSILYE